MPTEIYEVVAQGARYWFLFLMVLIAWRSYRWYARDRKQRKKRLRLLPDAGYIGEMVVIKGNDNLIKGTALPVPGEGTLGFSRMNDLCVPVLGVARRHCLFSFTPGEGLTLHPGHGRAVKVDDQERIGGRDPLTMTHGSRLYIGEAELRLRLFAGFETTTLLREERAADRRDEPQAAPIPQVPVMTREQFAQWQRQAMMHQTIMQQQYMHQMYSQWLAQQAAQGAASQPQNPDAAREVPESDYDDGDDSASYHDYGSVDDSADDQADYDSADHGAGYQANDDNGDEAGGYPANAYSDPVPYDFSPAGRQLDFDHNATFYPPAMDGADTDDGFWPYAACPQPGAEPDECADPGFAALLDEDLTDASVPPRSAYIGHDDSEEAKKRFWDKYLGGGGNP